MHLAEFFCQRNGPDAVYPLQGALKKTAAACGGMTFFEGTTCGGAGQEGRGGGMLAGMSENDRRTISELRQGCLAGPLTGRVGGQLEELTKKDSANGKPYWELKLRDATDVMILRAWVDGGI